MSANFPSGASDNGAEPASRSGSSTSATRAGLEERQPNRHSAESLRTDLANLKTDLDMLLSRAGNLSERELSEAYARMMTKFSSMRFAAKGIAAEAGRQLNQGVDITSDYVKAKPLQSVAMATGIGLLLGMLMTRR